MVLRKALLSCGSVVAVASLSPSILADPITCPSSCVADGKVIYASEADGLVAFLDGWSNSTMWGVLESGGQDHDLASTGSHGSGTVPEPSTLAFLGAGLLVLGGIVRRRFNSRS
jgi:PEP-CTERM motif